MTLRGRPTLRKDGSTRITVRVAHHLGATQLASILANALWSEVTEWGDHPDVEVSRAQAEGAVVMQLEQSGEEYVNLWREYVGEKHADEAWEWAVAQVSRLWPALVTTETEEV